MAQQKRIAFQGEPGAYSHQACHEARPDFAALPCRTFEDAIEAVRTGEAELAMLPVENSILSVPKFPAAVQAGEPARVSLLAAAVIACFFAGV